MQTGTLWAGCIAETLALGAWIHGSISWQAACGWNACPKCCHRASLTCMEGVVHESRPSTWDADFSTWQPKVSHHHGLIMAKAPLVKDGYCWIMFHRRTCCCPWVGVILLAGRPWTESQCQRCLPGGPDSHHSPHPQPWRRTSTCRGENKHVGLTKHLDEPRKTFGWPKSEDICYAVQIYILKTNLDMCLETLFPIGMDIMGHTL